jgi:hypothetical protein
LAFPWENGAIGCGFGGFQGWNPMPGVSILGTQAHS